MMPSMSILSRLSESRTGARCTLSIDEAPALFSQDFDRKMSTFLLNQPEVSKAYFEVFHPGEAVRDILTTMRDVPDRDRSTDGPRVSPENLTDQDTER